MQGGCQVRVSFGLECLTINRLVPSFHVVYHGLPCIVGRSSKCLGIGSDSHTNALNLEMIFNLVDLFVWLSKHMQNLVVTILDLQCCMPSC